MSVTSTLEARFAADAPGLIALLKTRADLERARSQHWYRVPVRSAPEHLLASVWVAFYLPAAFGPEKWSVRYWAAVRQITSVRRVDLLPDEPDHPRAQRWYYRLDLGDIETRPEPIFSRRRRRLVFIPSIWRKFITALEINDLHHGSPLEDRLWAAFQQEGIEAERQWWEREGKTTYCLDFALFCPVRNIDVECDGDRYHCTPVQALQDNARNNFLEQRGWHVLRFNGRQIHQHLDGCVADVKNTIHRCGGLVLADGRVRQWEPVQRQANPQGAPTTAVDQTELERLLASARPQDRLALLQALQARYGATAVTRGLARVLPALAERQRQRAVWCVGELGLNAATVEVLAGCLTTEASPNVRRLAYSACAKLRTWQLEDALLLALHREEKQVLQHVLNALAECGSHRAVYPIQRLLLRSQPPYVVQAAQRALQRCWGRQNPA